ncbi:MAG TPA: glycosyltransferase family 39 protein [Pirellulales bacterium]|nr:glycosyltransferase family 39 protein [Pirellulales bacterium]
MRGWRPNLVLLLILAVALALRLAAGAWWQGRLPPGEKFGFGDSQSYWALGRAIADGKPYRYGDAEVFRTPGYPLLLAPLFLICGDEPPVGLAFAASAVLSTAAVGGVYWLARNLFDRRTALIAAGLAAIYPGAIAQGALVLSEAPFMPLMLAQLVLWGMAWRSESRQRALGLALAAGIAAGLATLMRPSWLIFTPLALAVAMTSKQQKRHLILGAAMLAAWAAAMTPWWIRNYRVMGHFVPTTLQVGASLYDGLNPRADGSSNMAFVEHFTEQLRTSDAIAGGAARKDTFEYRLDRQMLESAVGFADQNPSRALELAGIKFFRTWNIWPNEPGLRAWPLRLAVAATYVPILLLGLLGAVRFSKRGWPFVLCWLPGPYFALLHMIFVGSIRYREPALIALIVLAAGVLSELLPARQPPAAPRSPVVRG